MAGILYGVGVGPGNPELMTVKAVKVIEECDIIGIPAKSSDSCTAYQIARKAVPEMEKHPVLAVPVPMTTDAGRLAESYGLGCQKIVAELERGKKVAFLNLGDPTVYGSYMELHQRVRALGYEANIINGVPSFCAVAAALEIPLGARKEDIHILPGLYHTQEIERYNGTRVLMKSAGRFGAVKEQLCRMEATGEGKAYAVTNCGMENQKIYREIGELPDEAGYFTTILVKELPKENG
jgi:precorrin-2 C(20)-methyltransferase